MHLPRSFYVRPTLSVAKDLLGKYLIRNTSEGKFEGEINEVEAYIGRIDAASHAHHGVTKRNSVLFEEGGKAYVYFIYGKYYCLNATTEEQGVGSGVLIRSVIYKKRGELSSRSSLHSNNKEDDMLINGPGKLCQVFHITLQQNGIDLTTSNELWIEDRNIEVPNIQTSTRIGITKSTDKLWRFFYLPTLGIRNLVEQLS